METENVPLEPQTPSPLAGGSGNPQENPGPSDLNTLLAGDAALQSQFDRLVTKALTTARGKWEREQSMSASERMEEYQRNREQELNEREQTLLSRELRVSALNALGERGLPSELADCISLTDEQAMRSSIASAERAFRAAVDQAVSERMRGAPPRLGSDAGAAHAAQIRQAMGLK